MKFIVAGFSIWVQKYQFPNSSDYWDGNWLFVEVVCETDSSKMEFSAACLRTDELSELLDDLQKFHADSKVKAARLNAMEPFVAFEFERINSLGSISVNVKLQPQTELSEMHRASFPIDQSYLPEIIQALRSIVDAYPVRGKVEDVH